MEATEMAKMPDDVADALDALDKAAQLLQRAAAVQADSGERGMLRTAVAVTRATVSYTEEYYG